MAMHSKIIFIFNIFIFTFSTFVASSEYFMPKHFNISLIKQFLYDLFSPYSFNKFLHNERILVSISNFTFFLKCSVPHTLEL